VTDLAADLVYRLNDTADACHSIALAAGLDAAAEYAHDACPTRLPTSLPTSGPIGCWPPAAPSTPPERE
jgi:hypothetical protein